MKLSYWKRTFYLNKTKSKAVCAKNKLANRTYSQKGAIRREKLGKPIL